MFVVMKRVFIAMAFVLAALCVQPVVVRAQVTKRLSRAAVDSLLNPTLHPDAHKIIAFDAVTKDIGDINESDSARTVRFAFCNVSDKPLTIARVTTHCGCTAAAFSKQPVAVGDSSVITVKYNPNGRAGTIDTNAFVYVCGAGSRPVAKLTILGNVVNDDEWSHLPYAMGSLRLKRVKVAFKAGRTVARIPCANVGREPLKLGSQLLPPYATFTTEPTVLQPGEEGDIVIGIDAAKVGDAKSFSLLVDGVAGGISSRTIKAIIEK